MKTKISPIKFVIACAVMLATMLFAPPAKAQSVYNWKAHVLDSTVLLTNAVTTITNDYVDVKTGHGISAMATCSSLAGDTNLIYFQFAVSLDKTNYSTGGSIFSQVAVAYNTNNVQYATNYLQDTLTLVGRLNGTNVIRPYKNFGASLLDNARRFKFLNAYSLNAANGFSTNTITVTRIETGSGF